MKIGFIGLGIMGMPMCINIIKKSGKEVWFYSSQKEKIDELVNLGAVGAESIKHLGENTDVIITMVPKSEHVEAVYEELMEVIRKGQILIDMSTIDPDTSVRLSNLVSKRGAIMLDAPVVKSKPAAINGTLGIYVGGSLEAFEKVKDVLLTMGNNVIHLGLNGSGLNMKICHNLLVAQIQNGVNEVISLAQKCGIDLDDFSTAISYGGGQNFYLDAKFENIRDNNFTTAFSVNNMNKDINIAYRMCENMGCNLKGLNLVRDVYHRAVELGFGEEDFSATYKIIENQKF